MSFIKNFLFFYDYKEDKTEFSTINYKYSLVFKRCPLKPLFIFLKF